jgi:RND family efflux transporter MFP subunit
MKRNQRLLWISGLVGLPLAIAVMAGLSGCGGNASSQGPPAPKLYTRVEVSLPVKVANIVDYEDFTGRIDTAMDGKVGLQAMVTGYLDKVCFVDGDSVKKDQVLFTIDKRIYQAKYNTARAAVEQTEARLERLNYDYDRGKALVRDGTMARSDYDKVVGDRLEAVANVGQAKAALDLADTNLKYTEVRSPITGKVSRRLLDPGNMVKANETMLTWIYKIDPMYGYFDVDERTVIKIRRLINEGRIKSYRDGDIMVEIGLADEEGFSMQGRINWVDNVLDAGTGTLKVRAELRQPRHPSHPDEPQVLVSPGMFVRMRLPISEPHPALLISDKAIGTDQGEKYVLIVTPKKDDKGNVVTGNDGKPIYVVDRRNVNLGQPQKGLRVIEGNSAEKGKDLEPTDLVIVSGLQRVRKGDPVTITQIEMPALAGVAPPALVPVQQLKADLPVKGKSSD